MGKEKNQTKDDFYTYSTLECCGWVLSEDLYQTENELLQA